MNINVVEDGDEYRISFKYDYEIKERVKQTPGRKWNPEEKFWTIPKNNLGMLINQFKGTPWQDMLVIKSSEEINVNQSLDEKTVIPNVSLNRVDFYSKTGKLYDHQIDFMKYAVGRDLEHKTSGFLVLDQMGAGKTLEAINLALYNKKFHNFNHCLILCCVNTSKYNWMNEIEEHTGGQYDGYILGTRISKRGNVNYAGSSQAKLDDLLLGKKYGEKDGEDLPYFLILNVEALRMRKGKEFPIKTALTALINANYVNMVVIDEVHKNLSPQSQQGHCLIDIKKKTGQKAYWLPMTGTPIVNKPTDLYVPLRLIDAHSINSSYAWDKYFCIYGGFGGYEIVGYKNMSSLKDMLQPNSIRRLKDDILDLPDKVEFVEFVENTKYQDKLYREVLFDLISHKEEIVESINPLAKMLKLRQVNGSPELVDDTLEVDSNYIKVNAKLMRLMTLVEEIKERGEKAVIFSNWVEPLRTIYRYLKPHYNIACFTGTMGDSLRQREKERFMNDPNCTFILGTIGALGTTHTLTAANNVIFYDEPWTAADRDQAIDRTHRISATKQVNIYTLLTKGTVDEKVHDILYRKKGISGYIVDNIDIRSNPELFDLLCS